MAASAGRLRLQAGVATQGKTYHLRIGTPLRSDMSASLLKRSARWPLLLALLLAGCAATTVDGTWTRPEAAGQRIEGPVLVVGLARDETVRRIFEDDMAAKLAARGIGATRSYEVVPGALDGDGSDLLLQAARAASARYLLSTAMIGQEIGQTIYQDPWLHTGFGGFRGWYGAYWGMSWPMFTQVRSFRVYIAQTALVSVDADRLEWVARTRTTDPIDIERETRAFADVILGAMAKDGLIAAAK